MVEELRAEAPPELPWGAIEARLLAEIARREARARTFSSGGPARVFAVAAAAAVVVLGALSTGSSEIRRSTGLPQQVVDVAAIALAAGEAGARGEHDLLSLKPGDVIEAAQAPVA